MQNLQEQGQKDLMDYGMGLQYDMWQKTGALAQRKQAEAAGMNPAMMYGGSGPGGVTGSASGSVGYGGGPSTGGEAIQGMGMMMQQQLMARIEYTQGNKWWATALRTYADLHTPALDQIGFEDLIGLS